MTISSIDRDRSQRIGLFGGTFNPIHRGHLQAAQDVLDQFRLERIFFIPSSLPPHKTESIVAPAEDRMEMVRLALYGHKALEACDIEINRGGRSYTYETIRHFRGLIPAGSQLFFLVGVDAFREIDTWKNSQALFNEAAFIILSRPPHDPNRGGMRADIDHFIRRHIAMGYRLQPETNSFTHACKQTIHLCSVTPVDISSSQLRTMLARGESIEEWVAPAVAQLIARKGLYR